MASISQACNVRLSIRILMQWNSVPLRIHEQNTEISGPKMNLNSSWYLKHPRCGYLDP